MENMNNFIEHTLLKPDCTASDIEKLIQEAMKYQFFGICINPCYVEFAKNTLKGTNIKLVTVVNFPLATNTINSVLFQTEEALSNGADEIDTVLNITELKNKNYKKVEDDIKKTKEICKNNNLKVILETDLLAKEEIILASKCAIFGGADFVKTSTGFVKGGVGATVENVKLMFETVKSSGLKVKASGGIKNYTQANALIEAGASRLGTSSGVDIILSCKEN